MDSEGNLFSNRKAVIIFLSVLLMAALAIVTLLYFKYFQNASIYKAGIQNNPTKIDEPLKVYKPESPIKKFVDPETGNAQYKIKGKFVSQPSLRDNIIFITFKIETDPLEREFLVRMGTLSGQLNVGYCDDPNCESGTWQNSRTSDVINQINQDSAVVISLTIPYAVDDHLEAQKDLLDQVIDEFNSGNHKTTFSSTDSLYALGLGFIQ